MPAVGTLVESRSSKPAEVEEGGTLKCDIFAVGDFVDVTGTMKGRGFAGNIKRHGFHRQKKTHGASDRERAPGSIGAGTTPGRVEKGQKMAGHYGNTRVTNSHLKVLMVDAERNLIAVAGSVPGANGGIVVIQEGRKQ